MGEKQPKNMNVVLPFLKRISKLLLDTKIPIWLSGNPKFYQLKIFWPDWFPFNHKKIWQLCIAALFAATDRRLAGECSQEDKPLQHFVEHVTFKAQVKQE